MQGQSARNSNREWEGWFPRCAESPETLAIGPADALVVAVPRENLVLLTFGLQKLDRVLSAECWSLFTQTRRPLQIENSVVKAVLHRQGYTEINLVVDTREFTYPARIAKDNICQHPAILQRLSNCRKFLAFLKQLKHAVMNAFASSSDNVLRVALYCRFGMRRPIAISRLLQQCAQA